MPNRLLEKGALSSIAEFPQSGLSGENSVRMVFYTTMSKAPSDSLIMPAGMRREDRRLLRLSIIPILAAMLIRGMPPASMHGMRAMPSM
jgi:hypothetical protein